MLDEEPTIHFLFEFLCGDWCSQRHVDFLVFASDVLYLLNLTLLTVFFSSPTK